MTVSHHSRTCASNSSGVVPAQERANPFERRHDLWVLGRDALEERRVLLDDRLVRLLRASDGSALISCAHLRNTKSNCGGIGCSTHNVPSLSNVAIRSATGMNPGPAFVVDVTKSTIACLAGPSLQLAST